MKGATAKDILYSSAETPEEADDIVNFIKEIVDKHIETLNKANQKKLEADLAGKPRGRGKKMDWNPAPQEI